MVARPAIANRTLDAADVAALDETAAAQLVSTVQRDANESDAVGTGVPSPLNLLDSAHQFNEGAYDIDFGVPAYDPLTQDTVFNLEDFDGGTAGYDLAPWNRSGFYSCRGSARLGNQSQGTGDDVA